MKKLLLFAAAAVVASVSTSAQVLNLSVDTSANWLHYAFAKNISDGSAAFDFPYGDLAGNGPVAQASISGANLMIGPNIGIYDAEIGNAAWVNQSTLEPILFTEMLTFYEEFSTAGTAVNFDWDTVNNDLASLSGTPTNTTKTASYNTGAFIKVLDSNGWGEIAYTETSLSVGIQGLSLVIPASIGAPLVQIGFFVEGDILAGTDPLGSTMSTVTVVPEPSTFALLGGCLALGVVLYRRRKRS